MKINWKKLNALVMGAILMLSLTGLGEGDVVIEDGATVDVEQVAKLDILEQPLAGADLEAPETVEAIDDIEVISNALVKKVSIGVKEKYTIDTSSLIGKLTFLTADKKIATVNKKGVVLGKKVGSTRITVVDGQGKKYKITVAVKTVRRQAYDYGDEDYFFLKAIDSSYQRCVRNPPAPTILH